MKKNTTSKLIQEMRTMLNATSNKRLTVEGLVYGEDGDEMIDDGQQQSVDEPVEQGQMQGHDQMQQDQSQIQQQGQMMGGEEMNPLDEDPEIAQLITNIRVETLQGLTALAETPESSQYELLKKIFLMIDKAVEDKVEEESGQQR